MTLDEFITLFQNRKLAVHVNSQVEKTDVLRFMRTSIFQHGTYDLPFDPYYQYVGKSGRYEDVQCLHDPTEIGASSIEYDEFCSIIYGQEETIDEKSILSLI